jgi:cytochrome P450
VYLVVHPDHVEQVLVSQNANHWKGRLFGRADFLFGNGLVLSDGEDWRRHRRIMNPGFSGDRLQAALGAMVEVIEDQAGRWRQAERDHRSVDIESEMTTLTLDLMATAMLGVRLSQHELEVIGRAGRDLDGISSRIRARHNRPLAAIPRLDQREISHAIDEVTADRRAGDRARARHSGKDDIVPICPWTMKKTGIRKAKWPGP